jgi:hypothetical protein
LTSVILSFERARQKRMFDKTETSRLLEELATDFPNFHSWAAQVDWKIPDEETFALADLTEELAGKLLTIAAILRGVRPHE